MENEVQAIASVKRYSNGQCIKMTMTILTEVSEHVFNEKDKFTTIDPGYLLMNPQKVCIPVEMQFVKNRIKSDNDIRTLAINIINLYKSKEGTFTFPESVFICLVLLRAEMISEATIHFKKIEQLVSEEFLTSENGTGEITEKELDIICAKLKSLAEVNSALEKEAK